MVKQEVSLESLILTAGLLKVTTDGSEEWYQVTSPNDTVKVDSGYVEMRWKKEEMNALPLLNDFVTINYNSLEDAEQEVKAWLSFNYLFALATAPEIIDDFDKRRDEFASSFKGEKEKMQNEGYIDLLKSNHEFAMSNLSDILDLSYDQILESHYQKLEQS